MAERADGTVVIESDWHDPFPQAKAFLAELSMLVGKHPRRVGDSTVPLHE